MPSPDGSFNLSGRVYGGSATSIGNLMVADGTGFYLVANAANRALYGRAQAIATSNWGGAQSGVVSLQFVGTCDSNLPNVGVGTAGRWVRCSAAGAFEVFTPTNGGSSDIVGCANAAGVVTMLFGVLTESIANAVGTPPSGADGAVQIALSGVFAGVAPSTSGTVLTSNGAGVAPSFQTVAAGGGATPVGNTGNLQAKAAGSALSAIAAGAGNIGKALVALTADTWAAGAIALASSAVSGILPVANGGTGQSSVPGANGALLYRVSAAIGAASAIISDGVSMFFGSGSIATTGYLNFPNATTGPLLAVRNGVNSDDICVAQLTSSNNLYIGLDSGFTATKTTNQVFINPSSFISLGAGGAATLVIMSDAARFGRPIAGYGGASIPFAFATGLVTMASAADRTLTATEYENPTLVVNGSPGANFNLIAPSAAWWVAVTNTTAFACTVKKSGGTGVTIAAGKTAVIRYDGLLTDYRRMTLDA